MEHNELLEIARIISDCDETVMAEISACLADVNAYYAANQARYEERGVEDDEEPEVLQWLGLVDTLEAHGYACERDWKDEKQDFFYFFSNLTGTKRLELDMREDWLDEDGCVSGWCKILDDKWADRCCCAAAIDIDSDSYVLFPCTLDELARLRELAELAGQRIELAEKM